MDRKRDGLIKASKQMSAQPSREIRRELRKFLLSFNPRIGLTFAINREVDVLHARRMIGNWLRRIDRHYLGRHLNVRSSQRSFLLGIFEHPDTNIHCHAIFHLPKIEGGSVINLKEFEEFALKAWRIVSISGDLRIDHLQSVESWVIYISNDVGVSKMLENFVLSAEFHVDNSASTIRARVDQFHPPKSPKKRGF